MSLGASGKLADALVYFPWKGLNVVREYVIPANPKTLAQTTQRGYLTEAVAKVHELQANATHPLAAADISAYALWASVVKAATTWFNQACRNWIDQRVAGKQGRIFSGGSTVPGTNSLKVTVFDMDANIKGGDFWYGTSKTALISKKAVTPTDVRIETTITGLTTGVKYFWQFRSTSPDAYDGTKSGIYYGVPK